MPAALTETLASSAERVRDGVEIESPPFIAGGPLLRTTRHGVVAVVVTLIVALIPVPGLYRAGGAPMEEGFMLYFPELVTRGEVPNADFLHLYGPGSLQVLAGWYEVFGYNVVAERTFGLLQNLALIAALYVIGRLWGRIVAASMAILGAIMLMTIMGLTAIAWHGALALGLWAIVFAIRARSSTGRNATINWAIAGVLAGLALSYRPDLLVAVGLVGAVGLWRQQRPAVTASVAGAAVGLLPMWSHLIMAGPSASIEGMVYDPVFELRPGRSLPAPPSWDHLDGALQGLFEAFAPWWGFPALGASKQMFLWFWAMLLLAVGLPAFAWWMRRRGDKRPHTLALLAAGLFSLGIAGQGVQRPDSTHLAWTTIVSWPLLVPAIAELLRRRIDRPRHVTAALACATAALVTFVVIPFYTYRPYIDSARIALLGRTAGSPVTNDGRTYYFAGESSAAVTQQAIDDLERWSKPGERLIVGPHDLSRTVYSETVLYWLLPKLEAGTYYVEMDPGIADDDDSRLPAELAAADWVILTTNWSGWTEPNASRNHGSQAANEVVSDRFCLVGSYGESSAIAGKPSIMLYHECGGGQGIGISPADVDLDTPIVPLSEG